MKKNGRGSSEGADELLRPELKGREVAGVAVARAVDVLHGPVLWVASCVQHMLHVLCQPTQVRRLDLRALLVLARPLPGAKPQDLLAATCLRPDPPTMGP